MRIFLTFAWIIGVIYATIPAFWIAVHPFADYWRSRRIVAVVAVLCFVDVS